MVRLKEAPSGNINTLTPKTSYKEYTPDQRVTFFLKTLQPKNSTSYETTYDKEDIEIDSIRGGGFFGKVLIPKDKEYVVKTSLPDSWHHLWRIVNWDFHPFPAQHNESAAQQEHLATRIIHTVLPIASKGKFYSPNSLGYAWLPTGFAQVVEKVKGRSPRFNTESDEYSKFKKAQQELSELAFNLGLEQVGQIHPNNPFGLANLWFDDKNQRWIWLDTIPAIPHRVHVYPSFRFQFHKEIRDRLNQGELTFNQIHTDKFREYLSTHRQEFPDDIYQQLVDDLSLYEKFSQRSLAEKNQALEIGPAMKALAVSLLGVAKLPKKILEKTVIDPLMITFKEQYRTHKILEGASQAKQLGLITQEEWRQAEKAFLVNEKDDKEIARKKKILIGLIGWYNISSFVINWVEYLLGAKVLLIDKDPALATLIGVIGETFPQLVRFLSTLMIEKIFQTNLKAAGSTSLLPGKLGGTVLPYPAQLVVFTGERASLVFHYGLRKIIAEISAISPAGGWGTDTEAKLYRKFGKKLEKFLTSV